MTISCLLPVASTYLNEGWIGRDWVLYFTEYLPTWRVNMAEAVEGLFVVGQRKVQGKEVTLLEQLYFTLLIILL